MNQAYKVSASIQSPGVVAVHFEIAPDYYLCRGQMKLSPGKDTALGVANLPPGKQSFDQFLGE